MSKRLKTPILLIAFNRPDLTRKVLTQIRLAKPERLYLAVDGSRNQSEIKKVDEVRNVIKEIDWKCNVKTLFADRNYGSKYGPVRAMNWFFKNEEMGIILEDDVWVHESFFYFAEELLRKYKNDTRVGSISGNNFQFGNKRGKSSFYFSRYSHSCGWATWRRAWKLYDVEIGDYEEKNKPVLDNVFSHWADKYYWKLLFNGIRSGEIDSAWDYQWCWMMWKNRMLGIIPNINLVKNMGYGRLDATHTKLKSRFAEQRVEPMKFPLNIPKKVERNLEADNYTQEQGYVLWKEVLMNLFRKFKIVKKKIARRI